MTIDLGTIKIVPKDSQAVTVTPEGSGWLGSIWDIIKSGATEIVKTGTNIILNKVQNNPPVVASAIAPVSYPAFVPQSQSPEIIYNPSQNPTSKFATDLFLSDSPILKIVMPTTQPAVSEGIKEGIASGVSKPPSWVWVALAFLGVIVLTQGVRK